MKFVNNFGFQISIFVRKLFHHFPKFFDNIPNPQNKKKHKNFQNLLTSTDRRD